MNSLRYQLYSFAAALMAAGESLKNSADNVPATADIDSDGVIDETNQQLPGAGATNTATLIPGALDGAGLPWDERIHASTKTIKADGTWTKRKGASPPVVAAVEAELRARAGSGAAAPALTPPAAVGGLALPGVVGGLALPTVALTNYQKLVAFLAAKTGPGKVVDDAWVTAAFTGWGLTLAGMATDEASAALVLAEFKKVLGE